MERTPFVAIASTNKEKGYLRLTDGDALSTSRFDVGGSRPQNGLKGFIYAERGVWRPGDSIYLNFMIHTQGEPLPANYPINCELYDPRGQLQEKWVTSENVNGLYPLHCATPQSAPTGSWMFKVKAGGASFTKILPIESIQPNRIAIQLDIANDELSFENEPQQLQLNRSEEAHRLNSSQTVCFFRSIQL